MEKPVPFLPTISVVVPVYNGGRTIGDCLDSLVKQDISTHRYEIIVVDNNSTDETCRIVNSYPVRLLHERRVQTSYAARNLGVTEAKGEIIAFTDADCVAASNWLTELAKPFKDATVGGVGGQVVDCDPENNVESFLSSLQLFANYQKVDSYLPVLLTNNVAYRRDLLEQLGLFNARLFTGADIDLAWRLQLETGARVARAPLAVIYHRHRSTWKTMAAQFRRHGFGEILLDAMYRKEPGYGRTPRRQLARMARQCRALLTYLRSFLYRNTAGWLRQRDRQYRHTPLFWLVAEASNLQGKMLALWATRFFRLNPAEHLWEDPGER